MKTITNDLKKLVFIGVAIALIATTTTAAADCDFDENGYIDFFDLQALHSTIICNTGYAYDFDSLCPPWSDFDSTGGCDLTIEQFDRYAEKADLNGDGYIGPDDLFPMLEYLFCGGPVPCSAVQDTLPPTDCNISVTFSPFSLPRTYEQDGPNGTEYVIELTTDTLLNWQALNIYLDIDSGCVTGNLSQTSFRLVPRSGSGRSFTINRFAGQYSVYFVIDNQVAPGYYDVEITQADGTVEIIPANIYYAGFLGYNPSGVLYNSVTGNVIRGAGVSIWRKNDQSIDGYDFYEGQIASNGTYSFEVPTGTYKVLVEYSLGGEQWRGPFQVHSPIPYEDMYLIPDIDDQIAPVVTSETIESGNGPVVTGTAADNGAGLAVVEFLPETITNADVYVPLYSRGAQTVPFEVQPQDPDQSAAATIRVIDQLGNETVTTIVYGQTEIGNLTGIVHLSCGGEETTSEGIPVHLYDAVSGDLVISTQTDIAGRYVIDSLEPGIYDLSVVPPLGYFASQNPAEVEVIAGETGTVDISLQCQETEFNPRGAGYWRHETSVALGKPGNAEIDAGQLCQIIDRVIGHFQGNFSHPVSSLSLPPASSSCSDKLTDVAEKLDPRGQSSLRDKAIRQLLAVCLNVAAGYVNQWDTVSADGATAALSIAYVDMLVSDQEAGNDELAKDIAEYIASGRIVPAGWVDLSIPAVAFKGTENPTLPVDFALLQNYPNPFNPTTTIQFSLPSRAHAKLEVLNVLGQTVRELVDADLESGHHSVEWDGNDRSGSPSASGIYFYRLEAGERLETRKMLLLK